MRQRTFTVDIYGIEEKDKYVLARIFKVTEGRTRSYVVHNANDKQQPDIVMVNVSQRDAIKAWGSRYLDSKGNASCPTLLVGTNKPKSTRFRYTPLPFFATRVLKILDEITVEDLKYTPELRIEEGIPGSMNEHKDLVMSSVSLSSKELESMIEKNGNEQKQNRQTVLVVDDSLPVRKALDMKLTLMNYDVELALNGEQALDLIQEKRYDSIFLDVVMPGIDGYEVCKKIKRNKKTKDIPVIMLTSRSSPFDRVKGKLAGCDTYLTKPVEHEEFHKVVSGYLK